MKAASLVQTTKTAYARLMRGQRERRIDSARRKKILKLYWNENMGLRRIAEVLEISHTTVWRVVNESEPPFAVRERLAKFGPLLAGI